MPKSPAHHAIVHGPRVCGTMHAVRGRLGHRMEGSLLPRSGTRRRFAKILGITLTTVSSSARSFRATLRRGGGSMSRLLNMFHHIDLGDVC